VRSCLILGTGRSGSSLLAGMLAPAGYYMGRTPIPPREGINEKGFFEDREVQEINEELLAPLFDSDSRRLNPLRKRRRSRSILPRNLRWAAVLSPDATVKSTPAIDAEIQAQVSNRPFCFKDPRFSYTLPAWRPHVADAGFICIFREPQRTANSVVTMWGRKPTGRGHMTYEAALANWRAMYRRILNEHRHTGDWLFVHYEQLLDGTAVRRLEQFTGARVDANFAEPGLKRSSLHGHVGDVERDIYDELCSLARAP
jgi:hypothetical protein